VFFEKFVQTYSSFYFLLVSGLDVVNVVVLLSLIEGQFRDTKLMRDIASFHGKSGSILIF